MSNYDRMVEMYAEGDLPWDDALPPPEVQALISRLEPGRALDLGCGYGRAAIYLAQRGWEVDAVDFVEAAVQEARRRAGAAGVAVNFHHHPVTDLGFLEPPYDFALDVGCGHAFDEEELRHYHAELKRLLRPGAFFLLFGRVQPDESPEDGPSGLDEQPLLALFTDGFVLEDVAYGETEGRDDVPWRSAWYRFRRHDGMG